MAGPSKSDEPMDTGDGSGSQLESNILGSDPLSWSDQVKDHVLNALGAVQVHDPKPLSGQVTLEEVPRYIPCYTPTSVQFVD